MLEVSSEASGFLRQRMAMLCLMLLSCWTLCTTSSPLSIAQDPNTPREVQESGFGVGPLSESAASQLLQQSAGNVTLTTRLPVKVDSKIPTGVVIRTCTVKGSFALTFDDGPYKFTGQVLDLLKEAGMPATFFVNGKNWGDIESPEGTALIKRTLAEGHQIASHTYVLETYLSHGFLPNLEVLNADSETLIRWSHANLTKVPDRAGIIAEMNKLDDALFKIMGKTPTYMRPPFYETDGYTLPVMQDLGFHVIQSDIDTWDWAWNSEALIQNSIDKFNKGLDAGGTLELSHDVGEWTVKRLVPAMIAAVKDRGLKGTLWIIFLHSMRGQKSNIVPTAMTVGDCLGDPPANWYRQPPGSGSSSTINIMETEK